MLPELLARRAASVAARIRRSLKPRRVTLVSEKLGALAMEWSTGDLASLLLLEQGKPYGLDSSNPERAIAALREALTGPLPALRSVGQSAAP